MAASISVVIPCYNQEHWIERCIESVLSQSHPPHQVIVVDDGSKDGSINRISRFGEKIVVIKQNNAGASAARNTGLAVATGEVVFFLDSDDYIEGDAFSTVSSYMSNSDVFFLPCIVERENTARELIWRFANAPSARDIYERWLDYYSQPPCTVYWRTEFIRSIGGWDERVSLNDDGELAMRAMLAQPRVSCGEGGYGVYNAHTGPSLSKTRSPKALFSELEAMKRLIASGRSAGWSTAGFRRKIYIIARGAFDINEITLGDNALRLFYEIGGSGHIGTTLHLIFSYLFGIKIKTIISRNVRNFMMYLAK